MNSISVIRCFEFSSLILDTCMTMDFRRGFSVRRTCITSSLHVAAKMRLCMRLRKQLRSSQFRGLAMAA